MELKKESVQTLRVKSRAASQITFDEDFNVPDVKPDIGRMIQNKGDLLIEETRINDGHGLISGKLTADLLYVGEEDGNVYSLTANLPFEEMVNLENVENGDKMSLEWEIEDLSLHMIHSRKLNIKAIVTFRVFVKELVGIQLPEVLEGEDIFVRKKQMRLVSLQVHKKDTLRVKEEMTLASNKPNISSLLWNTVNVRGVDFRPEEDRLKVKGELSLFLLYLGDDEASPVQWAEYTVPFAREMECSGLRAEMIPQIGLNVLRRSMEIRPDADGEERMIAADVVLELDMNFYMEEDHDVILDVYSPFKECALHGKPEVLDSLLVRNSSRCRVTDRITVKETQGKILQLCSSQGRVKIDKTQVVENGIRVEGIVQLQILYIVGNDNMPFYSMEAMLPFSHVVEVPGIDDCAVYYLQAELEQLFTSMPEGSEIEVKAGISLNVLVLRREEEQIIGKVEELPLDMKKIQSMPGITVYMTRKGDTLWEIAKRFYTTVEEICTVNGLENRELRTGQPLVLVKKVGSSY